MLHTPSCDERITNEVLGNQRKKRGNNVSWKNENLFTFLNSTAEIVYVLLCTHFSFFLLALLDESDCSGPRFLFFRFWRCSAICAGTVSSNVGSYEGIRCASMQNRFSGNLSSVCGRLVDVNDGRNRNQRSEKVTTRSDAMEVFAGK